MTSRRKPDRGLGADRARLHHLLSPVGAWDTQERKDIRWVRDWIDSGAPLYRTRSPDVPATHLVSYLVVVDPATGRLLLLWHRKAQLWLPAGGHVEPGEQPWQTVERESREELRLEAVAAPQVGPRPVFVTVTPTRGPGGHVDVSLWFLLHAAQDEVTWFDQREFASCAWLSFDEVLARPLATLDPHMHRLTRKLTATAEEHAAPAPQIPGIPR